MGTTNPLREYELMLTRRQLFGRAALGLGTAAMVDLLGGPLLAETANVDRDGLHHPAKAKRVIYLFMSGGPSHHDLWDYKPKMRDMFNQPLPGATIQTPIGLLHSGVSGICQGRLPGLQQANLIGIQVG